jgi:hypothetical protein
MASAFKSILYGFKIHRPYQKTRGVFYGIIDGIRLFRTERKSVSVATFLKYRKLKKNFVLLNSPDKSG